MRKVQTAIARLMGSRVIKRGKLIRCELVCQAGFPCHICAQMAPDLPFYWHVTCGQKRTTERMATKIKMLKLLQEADANAEIDRRPPRPALYMLQIRPRNHQPSIPKRRLPFHIEPEDYLNPVPVKIIFLKPDSKK